MIAGVAVAGAAAPAAAQEKCFDKGTLAYIDCPQPAPPPAPAPVFVAPPEPVLDWTGVYLGVHAGYGEADVSGGFFDFSNGGDLQVDFGDLEPGGFLIGGQLAYLHQFDNRIVLGAEIDASYLDADDATAVLQPALGLENASAELNALATLRARLGYAFDNVLPFVTAGGALVDYEIAFNDPADNNSGSPEQSVTDDTVFAPVVGGGVEVLAYHHWSFRAEGLYFFVDEETDFSALGDAGPGSSYELGDIWTLRGAINYKF